jgi:hypothetical protein
VGGRHPGPRVEDRGHGRRIDPHMYDRAG